MRVSKADQQAAIEELRTMLPPGSTVTTVLRHVSKSGMSRDIDCFKLGHFGEDHHAWLSRLIGKATGGHMLRNKQNALRISGCGMDMGFAIVYELSYALYRDGFGCIGEGCPSNDHSDGDRDYTPHGLFDDEGKPENREPYLGEVADGCRAHWHADGGYALCQRWL